MDFLIKLAGFIFTLLTTLCGVIWFHGKQNTKIELLKQENDNQRESINRSHERIDKLELDIKADIKRLHEKLDDLIKSVIAK